MEGLTARLLKVLMAPVLPVVQDLAIEGQANLSAAVQIAQLALKHRQNKNQRQRIVIFIGSPIAEDKVRASGASAWPLQTACLCCWASSLHSGLGWHRGMPARAQDKLVKVGRKLKKNNVAVDVVAFGSEDTNGDKLEALIGAVNSDDNSHLVSVPAGTILSDILFGSPIFQARPHAPGCMPASSAGWTRQGRPHLCWGGCATCGEWCGGSYSAVCAHAQRLPSVWVDACAR